MSRTEVSLEQTKRFTKLILDFVKKDKKLTPFYELDHTLENYAEKIASREKKPIDRKLLVQVLSDQYQRVDGASGKVKENIDSLLADNCFTVTTGHQLNIFTGPLYFIYKILHTIKLSDELNAAYTEKKFVPIYWMNSEDHDIEEVGQFKLFGKKYVWKTEQTGATGRMTPSELSQFLDTLRDIFGNSSKTLEIVDIFEKAYTSYENLSDATRYFTNALFGNRGLVIIDSDNKHLKASFSEYLISDIFENQPYSLVQSTNSKLLKADYGTQVNPREINCFYLGNGIRNRIVFSDDEYRVLNTDIRFSAEDLKNEIHSNPEKFSPNVVLRPQFQEFVLPNLTYVGGAGELSYWLQYKSYFDAMGVSYPMLCLRNHFLILNKSQSNRLKSLKMKPGDLFGSIDDLINKYVVQSANVEVDINDELQLADELYENLKTKAEFIDISLVASVEADQVKFQKTLNQWKGRFTRSLKQQNETSVNRIKKFHKTLFPEGYLQERYVNFLELYTQDSNDLFETVYDATEPFAVEFAIIDF